MTKTRSMNWWLAATLAALLMLAATPHTTGTEIAYLETANPIILINKLETSPITACIRELTGQESPTPLIPDEPLAKIKALLNPQGRLIAKVWTDEQDHWYFLATAPAKQDAQLAEVIKNSEVKKLHGMEYSIKTNQQVTALVGINGSAALLYLGPPSAPQDEAKLIQTAKQNINQLKTSSLSPPRLLKRAKGRSDLFAVIDLKAAFTQLDKTLEKVATNLAQSQNQQTAMVAAMVDLASLVDNLGLKNLGNAAISINLSDEQITVESAMGLGAEPPIPRYPAGPVPAFVPANTVHFRADAMDLGKMWSSLADKATKALPVVVGLINNTITQMELSTEGQLNIKRDLLENLGKHTYQFTLIEPPTNHSRTFFLVEVVDPAKATQLLKGIAKVQALAEICKLEGQETDPALICTLGASKIPVTKEQAPQPQQKEENITFALQVRNNYLVLSVGETADTQLSDKLFASKKTRFPANPELKSALATIPNNAYHYSVAYVPELLADAAAEGTIKKPSGEKLPSLSREQAKTLLAKYVGTGLSYCTHGDYGFHCVAKLTLKKKQPQVRRSHR